MYRDNERQRFSGRERVWPGRERETRRNRVREKRKKVGYGKEKKREGVPSLIAYC